MTSCWVEAAVVKVEAAAGLWGLVLFMGRATHLQGFRIKRHLRLGPNPR